MIDELAKGGSQSNGQRDDERGDAGARLQQDGRTNGEHAARKDATQRRRRGGGNEETKKRKMAATPTTQRTAVVRQREGRSWRHWGCGIGGGEANGMGMGERAELDASNGSSDAV